MSSTTEMKHSMLERRPWWTPWAVFAVITLPATVLGLVRGAPSAVLWLAFCTLVSVVLLFWEALRAGLDPTHMADEPVEEDIVTDELESRKRSALRALKDLEFEHSLGRIAEDDYNQLRNRYRAEARAAMEAMDNALGDYLHRAQGTLESVFKQHAAPAKTENETQENNENEAREEESAARREGSSG